MDPLTLRFARNLKALRLKKKLSQHAIAEQAKVSVSYISMLERAQRSPPLQTLWNISKVFKVHPAYFISGH